MNKAKAFPNYPNMVTTGPFGNAVTYDAVILHDGAEVNGTADGQLRTIEICTDQPPTRRYLTLLHEAVHHYDYLYGFNLKHRQVVGMSTCIYDLIVNNRDLVLAILDAHDAIERPAGKQK